MEEGAINTPDYGRQKAKVRIASERTSSIDQPRLSSTTECSPYSSSLRSTTSDAFASLDAASSQPEFVQTNAGEPTPSEDYEPESVQIYIGELSPSKYLSLSSSATYHFIHPIYIYIYIYIYMLRTYNLFIFLTLILPFKITIGSKFNSYLSKIY
jgi:hypothetical protein